MPSPFDEAVEIILNLEGVHNVDAGGDTWYGIAKRFHLDEFPWPPTRERAIEIYREEYWEPNRCGELPRALGIALFDAVVNQGDAVKNFQRALKVAADGVVGPVTLQTARTTDQWEVLALFFARRAQRYATVSRPQEQIGLLARLFRVQRYIMRLE